jgi:hypothetical protein
MPRIVKSIDVSTLSKRNREWMTDEFFDHPVNRDTLRYCAEHYRDISAHNVVCSEDQRSEYAQRARYLTRLAATLR